jgi:hypothetical protein
MCLRVIVSRGASDKGMKTWMAFCRVDVPNTFVGPSYYDHCTSPSTLHPHNKIMTTTHDQPERQLDEQQANAPKQTINLMPV